MPTQYAFTADVLFNPDTLDGYMKHYVPVPEDVAQALRGAGITHVRGTLDNRPFRRALFTLPNGIMCMRFGKSGLDRSKLSVLDEVSLVVQEDDDPHHVDIPEELAAEFETHPEVEHVWLSLSPGKRRTLIHPIENAKQAETRQRRARDLVMKLG
jgi:hypothetical protein